MSTAEKRTVIVAEKPSVAREIAKVLGVRGARSDGHISDARYSVTWAIGHLVNIAEPDEQNPAWGGRWSPQQLPMIPERFKLAVLPGTMKQFGIVKRLLTDANVGEVINATDAGREGELIFRRIALMAGCDKPVKRLWASDMTEQGLKKALASTVPDKRKRNLGLAAFARAEADWLIGMNFSRLFTLKDKSLITVGRVQTPVLKLLVDRRREIEHFTPKDYWTIEARLARGEDAFDATWHAPPEFKETRIDDKAQADGVAETCTGASGKVVSVKSRNGQQKPPLPFDLTTLQREANSRFGLSAKDTLGIAQALYEQKKCITYPRTDSRYLTRELFKEILGNFRAIYGHFPEPAAAAAERIKDGKSKFACVNDKKVSDHHAIIPTTRKVSREALSADEWNIYEMVCRRTCAAFMAPAKYGSSTVWAEVEEHRFKATGKVFKDHGWLAAEPWRTAKDNPLPKLRKGSPVDVASLEVKPHQTKPPSHFTDASLLAAMETAGKLVDDEELREAMKERGLGTPATRAQIIETLLSRKYIEKQKKKLIATDAGIHAVNLIESLLPQLVSPQMTGDWEKRLKDIELAQDTYPAFMRDIRAQVADGVNLVRNWRAYDKNGFPVAPPGSQPAAPKPRAPRRAPRRRYDVNGFPIEERPDAPSAARTGAARPMSEERVFAPGPHPAAEAAPQAPARPANIGPDGFPIDAGTQPYSKATGRGNPRTAPPQHPEGIDRDGFPADAAKPSPPVNPDPIGTCPFCGKGVFEHANSYDCAGLEGGSCEFKVSKRQYGGDLLRAQARDLVVKGRTYKRGRFVSKAGKKFNAFLKLTGTKVDLLFE